MQTSQFYVLQLQQNDDGKWKFRISDNGNDPQPVSSETHDSPEAAMEACITYIAIHLPPQMEHEPDPAETPVSRGVGKYGIII